MSTSQKVDYILCCGIKGVHYWAHREDVIGSNICFTCAKSGSRVADKDKRLAENAASLLENLSFPCLEPCTEKQFTTAFKGAFKYNLVVLKLGTNLLLDRIPLGHVCIWKRIDIRKYPPWQALLQKSY